MSTHRPLRKKALTAAIIAATLVAPAAQLSAMIWPAGYCSDNLIDRRSFLSYNGCGGVNWGDTWHRYFG
jgi:hypothetical protein